MRIIPRLFATQTSPTALPARGFPFSRLSFSFTFFSPPSPGSEKGRCVASEYFTEPEIEITTENTANILSKSLSCTHRLLYLFEISKLSPSFKSASREIVSRRKTDQTHQHFCLYICFTSVYYYSCLLICLLSAK